MEIEQHALVPAAMLDRLDDDLFEVARVTGVATTWHVLATASDTAHTLYVIPDYSGPRGNMERSVDAWVVKADQHTERPVRLALANAASLAAVGIAQGLAMEGVLVEST